jgi:hypothetical protein
LIESSAIGIVAAVTVFPKYETEARRSTYLNPTAADTIINTTRRRIEKKLFLGSSKKENSKFISGEEDNPINIPTKAKANKNITSPVE